MASPTDFLTGKAKRTIIGPIQAEPERPSRINASNCVQLDDTSMSYGGNSSGGLGQDAECNAFERFLQNSLQDVRQYNERLAEKKN